ncbi:MAG: hypothetical protein L0338_37070 [Acidobacteria bacterium]|nr:hypothetical protein [Verrucomicrobiales bacterium]MCI0724537.1 hypothetical protein [Acidobacteriota bacterium]
MNPSNEAQMFWQVLLDAHPRRSRFVLENLLEAFRKAFPYRQGDADARGVIARLLAELEQAGVLRLPRQANRRAHDHSERTRLPKHIVRLDRPRPVARSLVVWRPELAFARDLGESWWDELLAIQEWLRNGGTMSSPVALRERSVEIFGDERCLDSLLGSQLFAPDCLTLDLLRCYLPSVPIYVVSLAADAVARPLLVVENHTTFDTLCRWNQQGRRYAGIAFGAGTAFVAACESLRVHLAAPGCSGHLLYFGDLDPTGLWIPARATRESGIEARPDEGLYALLLSKGSKQQALKREPFSFDPAVLDWLPLHLRAEVAQHFNWGRRLPQELVSLPDLGRISD